jgi:hypothetical protein
MLMSLCVRAPVRARARACVNARERWGGGCVCAMLRVEMCVSMKMTPSLHWCAYVRERERARTRARVSV